MRRCRTCKRLQATAGDWEGFAKFNAGACSDETCCWGGDRCWYEGECGFTRTGEGPDSVVDLEARAKAVRGRRQWKSIPHSAAEQHVVAAADR